MASPHAPRASSRDLLAAGLALLAATLLTGCDNPGRAVEAIAKIFLALIVIWTIFLLVLMTVALVILIVSTHRLASGRPSIAWGTTAFVLGFVDLSALDMWTLNVKVLLARQDMIGIAALLLGIGLVLVGGLNLFLALHRKSKAAASARLTQEVDATPAEAEQEPPKVVSVRGSTPPGSPWI
jgi:hypothetical protein